MPGAIEHKVFESEIKAAEDDGLIIEHFISTETKDRGGDIMRANGMKIVGKPVVLQGHGHGAMGSEPIAKPLSIGPGALNGQKGIVARTQFFPDETGRRLYQKAKDGYAPNWSIGYMVEEAKDIMEQGRYSGRDVLSWSLLEYSMVGVPMNPGATNLGKNLEEIAFKMMTDEGVPVAEELATTDEKAEEIVVELDTVDEKDGSEEQGGEDAAEEKEAETTEDTEPETKEDPPDLADIGMRLDALAHAVEGLVDTVKSLLPTSGEPAPEEADEGDEKYNSPEEEPVVADPPAPPRLVFSKDKPKQEEEPPAGPQRITPDALKSMIGEAMKTKAQEEFDKLRGKVP